MPSLGDSTSQTRWDDKTIALFQLSSRTFSQSKGVRGSQSVDIKSSTKSVRLLHLPVLTVPNSFSSAAQSKLYPASQFDKTFNPVFGKWPGMSSKQRSLCGRVQRPPGSLGQVTYNCPTSTSWWCINLSKSTRRGEPLSTPCIESIIRKEEACRTFLMI